MAQEVPTQKTVVAPTDMFDSLVRVWNKLVGRTPTRAQILMLLAQWALETGNGQSENNFNPGGIKHASGDGYDWTSYTTTEVVNNVTQTLTQTFAAYPDLDTGTTAYVNLLQTHYPQAWQSVLDGGTDPTAFATGLKAGGYFTAPVETTTGADGKTIPGYAPGLIARLAQMTSSVPDSEPLTASAGLSALNPIDATNALAGAIGLTPVQFYILAGVGVFVGWSYYTGRLQRLAKKVGVHIPQHKLPDFPLPHPELPSFGV